MQKPGDESGSSSALDTFGWSGAYNTYFRIDPHHELIVVLLTQQIPPFDDPYQDFHNTGVQAMVRRLTRGDRSRVIQIGLARITLR